MAALHAGIKRSLHQMQGQDVDSAPRPHHSPASNSSSAASSFSGDGKSTEDLRTGEKQEPVVHRSRQAAFKSNASIVLIGLRGVGKSSLGVLAATAYGRRLIDSEREFLNATGETQPEFRRLHGPAAFHARRHQILKRTLEVYSEGCVVVCSFSDLESSGAALLKDYSQSHAVIHVSRDVKGIHSHLEIWSEDRISAAVNASGPLLRSCSSFEFVNLSESFTKSSQVESTDGLGQTKGGASIQNGPYLMLKRVERDFLRLLRNIVGDHGRGISHHSVYPLSNVAVELREYTYAVRVNMSDVLAEAINLEDMQVGADCVELVLDETGLDHELNVRKAGQAFATIRRATILPILLTVGQSSDRNVNFDMAKYCLRLGPEYCTVDLSLEDSQVRDLVGQKGTSKIVGYLYGRGGRQMRDSQEIIDQYDRAVRLGCDIVKITRPAAYQQSNRTIYSICHSIAAIGKQPLIAYETGPEGRTSKVFNKILTSVSHGNSNKADEEGDGQVSARELTQALYATFVLEPMRFMIFGADVSYSLSPAMHNAAYHACGMPHTFEKQSSSSLTSLVKFMQSSDFGGAAITLPFKTTVISKLDGVSRHAKTIGAVNTVIPIRKLTADGSIPDEIDIIKRRNQRGDVKALYGYNTDWIGIRACVRKSLSPANTIRSQSSALICGAGGMARAGIYALISLGIKNIFLWNRTHDKAQALAEYFNHQIKTGEINELSSDDAARTQVQVLDSFNAKWPERYRQPTVIISCIPTQTAHGLPIDVIIPEEWLKSATGGVAVEVAYKRSETQFKSQIGRLAPQGWILMDGYDVIPEQAYSQFELFTGRRAPRHIIRGEALKNISNTK